MENKKILIASYYGLRECLLSAAKSLEKIGYEIDDYPLLKYSSDINDKRSDYVEHFNSKIQESNPKVILFWCLAISASGLEELRKQNVNRIFALFNWDDPHCWSVPENQMERKAKWFDIVFITCKESCLWYLERGVKKAIFLTPGFDPNEHYYINTDYYKCQVSFCITNLYHREKEQLIPRKKLIDDIIADGTIDFKLFGPKFLQKEYPNHYAFWVGYYDTRYVFSNSMINICTHVTGSKQGYINERCILITGSNGCMLVDPIPGIEEMFVPEQECILLDIKNPVEQIKNLLKDPERLKKIGENAGKRALRDYTYDRWAATVDQGLNSLV